MSKKRIKKGRVEKIRLFMGNTITQCSECGRTVACDTAYCPGCMVELNDAVDRQLAPISAHLDEVLYKHHPEAEFDYPGGLCDNDDEYEP